MCPKETSVRAQFARRDFLGVSAALVGAAAAGPLLAQQPPTPAVERVKGPPVWLDMDQSELDAAYDQSKYAPNLPQITKRYATNSEAVRSRLGAPRQFAYGPTAIESLDVYATKRPNAPINVFIHGGAWRVGLAKDYAFPAELFVYAGAHLVVPDFVLVQDAGGSLMPMADKSAARWLGSIAMPKASAAIPTASMFPATLRAATWQGSCSPRTGAKSSTYRLTR